MRYEVTCAKCGRWVASGIGTPKWETPHSLTCNSHAYIVTAEWTERQDDPREPAHGRPMRESWTSK